MFEEILMKHALKNAFDFVKADVKAVMGHAMAEIPNARENSKQIFSEAEKTVSEVNALSNEEIGTRLKNYSFEEKKEETEKKFRIDGTEEGKVVTRFLPEPNGYLHLGHAKAVFLSYELARQYNGKCLLRFDDTNPEKEKTEYVDAIRRNLQWLGLKFSEKYTSDRMGELYGFAEKMLKEQKAYACTCAKEEIGKNRMEMKECSCRARSAEENISLWERMKKGESEKGEAILRFRGGMKSANTVMRDPSLFRVVKTEHFRQGNKYSAWPTYDFEASISDSLDGVTHALRSKEYELRDELYYAILDALNLRKPVVYDFARLNLRDRELSKRLFLAEIKENIYDGWDDQLLPTLDGLKKRGVLPEAIKNFVLSMGLSKSESEPSLQQLLDENKRLLDAVSPRYHFVREPVRLLLRNGQRKTISLKNHPSEEMGSRNIETENEFFISRSDTERMFQGEIFRLRELFNVKLKQQGKVLEAEIVSDETLPEKKLQWVSAVEGEWVRCSVSTFGTLLKQDEGYCEKACLNMKEGDVAQFVRYGFVKFAGKTKERNMEKLQFVFVCQ